MTALQHAGCFLQLGAGFCIIQVVNKDRNKFTSRNFAVLSKDIFWTTEAPAAFWRATRAHLPNRATVQSQNT